MFCVKGLLGEHKKNYQITSVPYMLVLSLLWYQQALWSSSWIVVVKRAGAMGNQPSGVDIPWEVRMSGKADVRGHSSLLPLPFRQLPLHFRLIPVSVSPSVVFLIEPTAEELSTCGSSSTFRSFHFG